MSKFYVVAELMEVMLIALKFKNNM